MVLVRMKHMSKAPAIGNLADNRRNVPPFHFYEAPKTAYKMNL